MSINHQKSKRFEFEKDCLGLREQTRSMVQLGMISDGQKEEIDEMVSDLQAHVNYCINEHGHPYA